MRRILLLAGLALLLGATSAAAGRAGYAWHDTPTGTTDHFRGLSAISATTAWVSGYTPTGDGAIMRTTDRGATWHVAYTFPRGAIRHVHNIVFDEWANCLWVLTGDNGPECRILRFSCDFKNVDTVLSGDQQARAVALVPTPEGLYFSSDTPLESNHVYRLDRGGMVAKVAALSSSSIYGCRAGGGIFFSTMVEPSQSNLDPNVQLYGSGDGLDWRSLMQWPKDFWPMSLFQYGNAILPDGRNKTEFLALTTVAVNRDDLATSIWRVRPSGVL